MSGATSLGESDAKFPGQESDALPPSPTPENPGQVYPKSDPTPAPPGSIPGAVESVADRVVEVEALKKKSTKDGAAQSAETGGMFTD